MATIKTIIIEKALEATKERLEKLIEMGAPQIMVTNLQSQVAEMEAGDIKVGGDASLLDAEVIGYEVKKGNGGKSYIQFDNGTKYFPNAKYGRFITK